MNGLDLFSGIGGISIALKDWVRPIAYCEIDPYCQQVLLTNISNGSLYNSPIWDDIQSLSYDGRNWPEIDIIYGGFPCQDISVAGHGKGLEGERSGLFKEIVRLAKEINPSFIFLENVPAISTRGGLRVVREITEMGYDCRWCIISASSIGALHKRERWFLLGHAHSKSSRKTDTIPKPEQVEGRTRRGSSGQYWPFESREHWQKTVSGVCRASDGVSHDVDRLRALGNAVVPQQCREAFKILMGIHD